MHVIRVAGSIIAMSCIRICNESAHSSSLRHIDFSGTATPPSVRKGFVH